MIRAAAAIVAVATLAAVAPARAADLEVAFTEHVNPQHVVRVSET